MVAVTPAWNGRDGVAVPLALVLVVALGLLGAGVLALAEREATAGAVAVNWVRGRVVADGMVRTRVLSLDPGERLPRGPLWEPSGVIEGTAHGVRYGGAIRALGGEWSLVTGWARGAPGGPPAVAAAVVWSLDPLARVGARAAVLVHGGVLVRAPEATVEGSDVTASGEWASAAACARWGAALDSIFPTGRLAPSAWDPDPEPPPLPALGLLRPQDLQDRLPGRVVGAVTPTPTPDGVGCPAAPDNWGSPRDPDGPCGERRVALYAPGDLTLEGGEGQGLLLVEGRLALEDGAVFAGLVVVRDTLRMGTGTTLVGLARSGGPTVLDPGARLLGRACPAVLAMEAVPALGGPLPAPGGAWIRPF